MKLLLGTASGLYVLEGDAAWKHSRLRGPILRRHALSALARDDAGLLAASGNSLYASRDGLDWSTRSRLPRGQRISALTQIGDTLLAGTEPAGLWSATVRNPSWREIAGLRAHSSAAEWWADAGAPAVQAIAADPRDPSSLFVAISIAGIFHGSLSATADEPWSAMNEGLPPLYPRGSQHREAHRDVRALVVLPAADGAGQLLVAATSHGLYVAAPGDPWVPCAGDWAWPGVHTLAVSPASGTLYAVARGVDGRLSIYRSRDRARDWDPLASGLPDAVRGVERDALAAATLADGGEAVYLGTTQGEVYWTLAARDEWLRIARNLPAIHAILPLHDEVEPRARAWRPFHRA